MNSKQKEEFRKVVLELDKYNLNEHVSLSIGDAENDKGKKTKHIFAYWLDTTLLNKKWVERETCKSEEMSKFFSGELFALGISQKVAWIKASREEKVAYIKAVPNGHPALFPVWRDSKLVNARMAYEESIKEADKKFNREPRLWMHR